MSRYRSDLHQTRPAQWAIQQLGRALVIAMGVAWLLAIISALSNELAWSYLAVIAAQLAFGMTLWSATAPMPLTDEDPVGLADPKSEEHQEPQDQLMYGMEVGRESCGLSPRECSDPGLGRLVAWDLCTADTALDTDAVRLGMLDDCSEGSSDVDESAVCAPLAMG